MPRDLDPGALERGVPPGSAEQPAIPVLPASGASRRGALAPWANLFDLPEIVSAGSLGLDGFAAATLEGAVRIAGAKRGLLFGVGGGRSLAIRAAQGFPVDLDPR